MEGEGGEWMLRYVRAYVGQLVSLTRSMFNDGIVWFETLRGPDQYRL